MKMFVCTSCLNHAEGFLETVQTALPEVAIEAIDCMSGCTRNQTVAFRATGKTAYLFGDISHSDLPDLRVFVDHYQASPDGRFEDARILGALRHKAVARIPA